MEKKTKCESTDGTLYCVVKDGKLTGAAQLCDGRQQVGSCPDGCKVGAAVKNQYRTLDLDATCPNKRSNDAPTAEVIAAP